MPLLSTRKSGIRTWICSFLISVLLPAASTLVARPATAQGLGRWVPPARAPLLAQDAEGRAGETWKLRGAVSPSPGETAAPDPASHAQFRLRTVDLEGASAVAESELAQAYAPFLGQDVSQADLTTITAALGRIYRDAGYHLTRAIIPAQDLANGRLRIQIVEGAIEEVVVLGDDRGVYGLPSLFSPLTAERPSRRATLERQLLLANDRPGVRVTDTTLDEIEPGSGRFRLKVTAQTWTVYGAVGIDNLGPVAAGPWQSSASLAINSLALPGDSLVFSGSMTPGSWREFHFGSLAYDVPVGLDGLRIGAAANMSEIRPGDARRWQGTISQTETYELRAWYAPLVSQDQTLWLGGALGVSNNSGRTYSGPSYDDHFGLLSLSADYRLRLSDDSWSYLFVTFRQGLGSVDGDLPSRTGASTRFSLVNASFAHYQNLGDAWSLKLSAGSQIASDPLPISQQFYLGGYSFGRGFEAGWIAGDNAVAVSGELRYDIPVRSSYLNALQLYGFVEGGATQSYFHPNDVVQKIATIGAGVRLFVTDGLVADVTLAKPIVDTALSHRLEGISVLFSLTNVFRLCPTSQKWLCN